MFLPPVSAVVRLECIFSELAGMKLEYWLPGRTIGASRARQLTCFCEHNFIAFPDGFDFKEGWKKHVEESDKKVRDLLESYYKKCQQRNVSEF